MADVSVIIPVHNRAALVGAALNSVLAQTRPARQVLVVDDGSSDETPGVVAQFERQTSGLVRLVRQANAGPSAARNHGLRLAQGQFIAFLDADDLWLPTKIQKQIALLESLPDAAGAYCRMFKFHRQLDDLGREEPLNMIDDPSLEHIVLTMCIQASTAVVRRSALTHQDGSSMCFDESIRAAEDALFFADARLAGPWRMVDEPLTAYRVHGVQLTRDPAHALATTQTRVAWCGHNRGRLGAPRAQALQERLWLRLIEYLERRYWSRQVEGLARLRDALAEERPDLMRRSFLAQRRIYPRWVYRLRDAFTRRSRALTPSSGDEPSRL